MSKAVLISIRPQWCQKIANGEKTIEVRKKRPKLATPFRCYIYCTSGGIKKMPKDYIAENLERGKVVGEFVCDKIDWLVHVGFMGVPEPPELRICDERTMVTSSADALLDAACLSAEEVESWFRFDEGYGWHISGLQIYAAPRELGSFRRVCPEELNCESCAFHSEYTDRCGNEALYLHRAPQSWCYVKEDTK